MSDPTEGTTPSEAVDRAEEPRPEAPEPVTPEAEAPEAEAPAEEAVAEAVAPEPPEPPEPELPQPEVAAEAEPPAEPEAPAAEPVQQASEPEPVRQAAEPEPVQKAPEPEPVQELAEAAGTSEAGEAGAAPEPATPAAEAAPSAAASGEMTDAEAQAAAEQRGEAQAVAPQPEAAAGEQAPLPTDPVSLRLLEALEKGTAVEGKVFGWNQGGFHVLIDGLLAFCPRSEIEIGNPKAPKKYIEKTYRFRVLEHRRQGNRFIVSRAKVLDEERARRAAKVRELLSVGAELDGHVTSLTSFGAFADLGGGIEGMVHVSELSHRSVNHPKELLKKGQKVRVKVLKIEEEGNRISLSIKALETDPWAAFSEAHARGSAFTGKVTGKTEFGVFVEVEPGMEGLVHVSALAPGAGLEDEAFEPGKEVAGWIKEVEVKRHRISLSMRPIPTGDPWRKVEERYPEGEMVTGTVEEIAPFGVFINLEPGLTGLLPTSEMNLPRGTHPGRVYAPGSEVQVQVGRIESKRKRITLLPEGARIEGSRTDYRDYKKRAKEDLGGGMPTLAAAFAKLKQTDE